MAAYPARNKPKAKTPALPIRTRDLPNMVPPVSSPQPATHARRIAQTQFKFCRILVPARDSRAESVHLKPDSTHNFESDTVLPATDGCGLYMEPAGIQSDARSARSVSPMKYFTPLLRTT